LYAVLNDKSLDITLET
jgi:hypothetical protein